MDHTWQSLQRSVGRRAWQALPSRQRTALTRAANRMRAEPLHPVPDGQLSDIINGLVVEARRQHGVADSGTVAKVAAVSILNLQTALRQARFKDLGLGEAAP